MTCMYHYGYPISTLQLCLTPLLGNESLTYIISYNLVSLATLHMSNTIHIHWYRDVGIPSSYVHMYLYIIEKRYQWWIQEGLWWL